MISDRITRTAFVISFIGHCLFLGMPGISMDSSQVNNPEDMTVKIEIEKPSLLPRIDIMGEEKKFKEVIKKPKPPEPEPKPQPKEEVVIEQPPKEPIEENIEVIDPAQEAMLRYQDMVKQRIEQVRRYPSWAKKQEIEGVVYLSFVVLLSGLSKDIKIIHSSGFKILDEEAVATIKRAHPFPPIPQEINQEFVLIEVAIIFKLE